MIIYMTAGWGRELQESLRLEPRDASRFRAPTAMEAQHGIMSTDQSQNSPRMTIWLNQHSLLQ